MKSFKCTERQPRSGLAPAAPWQQGVRDDSNKQQRRAAPHAAGCCRLTRTTFRVQITDLSEPEQGGVASLTFRSDGNQFHPFTGDEVERFVDIGDLVDPHLASLRFGQAFAWRPRKRGDFSQLNV